MDTLIGAAAFALAFVAFARQAAHHFTEYLPDHPAIRRLSERK